MKSPYDIIRRPLLTENSYDGIALKRYAFLVDPNANKTEIKYAVEKIFDVKVDRVNTLNSEGKLKRQGEHIGRRPSTKKAFVHLAADSKPIKFFENLGQ